MNKEEQEKKMLEALEKLAFGAKETKTVTQYKRGANGRDVVTGKVITETQKTPDRGALNKLMEITGVYVDANIKLKQSKLDEVGREENDLEFLEDLSLL